MTVSVDIIARIDQFERSMRRAESSATGAFRSIRTAASGLFAGIGVASFVSEISEATQNSQRLARSLEFTTGSAAGAQQQLDFLSQEAERLGTSLVPAADGFTKLLGSIAGTNIQIQTAQDLFSGLSAAQSLLGTSTEQASRAIFAVGQIASKGVVSMEELRLQLSEALPGAMSIAARSMNLGVAEFQKLVASGELASDVFLPRFAEELKKTFGGSTESVRTLTAEMNRLETASFRLFESLSKAGVGDALASAVRAGTDALKGLTNVIDNGDIQSGLFILRKSWDDTFEIIRTTTERTIAAVEQIFSDFLSSGRIGSDIGLLIDQFRDLDLLRAFRDLPTNLSGIFTILIGEGDKLIITLIEQWEKLKLNIERIDNQIALLFIDTADVIKAAFAGAFNAVLDSAGGLFEGLANQTNSLLLKIDPGKFPSLVGIADQLRSVRDGFVAAAGAASSFQVEASKGGQEQRARIAAIDAEIAGVAQLAQTQRDVAQAAIADALEENAIKSRQLDQLAGQIEAEKALAKAQAASVSEYQKLRAEVNKPPGGPPVDTKALEAATKAAAKLRQEIERLAGLSDLQRIASGDRLGFLLLARNIAQSAEKYKVFNAELERELRLARIINPEIREREQRLSELTKEFEALGFAEDEAARRAESFLTELQRIEQQTDSARAVTEAFTLDAREFTDAWISGLSSVADFMAEGLVNGFDNAADAIKGAFKTLLAELIRVAVLNPVLLQVGLGGLGLAGLGPGAAGTAAGGVGLLGSGLSSILGNFAGAGVSLLGQGLFGAGAGAFGSGVLASGGALSGLGLFGGTAANIGNVASLFGAGQFAAGGGALLGAALPILAPLAIGAIASGLFGNQEPPGRSQTASINITAGTLNFAGSAPGDSKFSEENRGIAQSTAQQVAAFTGVVNQFEDAMLRAVSFGGDEITARLQDLVIGVEISDRDNESRIVIDTEATGRLFEEIFSKGEEAEAIARAIDFILDSLEGLPDFFAPIVAQFDRTDPERLLQGAQALADINRALEVDIVKEFNRQLRESNRTLAEVTLDQGLAVLDMARNFDGSIDATLQLSQATGQFFQTTFALLAQIQEISASLASSFQASIERFQLAALDQSQTYEFFVARAERAFNQLRDATDPAQIEQAAREFDRFLNSAFGVLSPEQQAAMSQAFIDAAEEGNRISQERLDAAADQAATGTEQLQAAIADALGRVAGTMQAAGDAQLQAGNLQIQAAATPVTVRVEFEDAEAA